MTQTWLPILMPGVAAAAFHPLIMLHYALDAENDRGVAHALAYFAWAYLPMGDFAATEHRELDFAAAVSRLASIDRAPTAAGLFSERLRREAQRPEVSAILAKLGGSGNPADAMELAVSTYYAINDLLSLHMVTACHAYQRIVELLTHEDPELRLHLLRALLVAYVACDTPKLEPIPSTTAVDWQAISERAQHDPDEHVIKIVWTCRDMQERWGTDVSALAARAVGLSDTPPA